MRTLLLVKQIKYTLLFTLISTASVAQANLQKDWNKPRKLCPSFEEVVGVQVSDDSSTSGQIKLYLKSSKKPYDISISKDCNNSNENLPEEIIFHVNSNVFSFDNLPAGNYQIKLTDRNGCSYQKCITLGNQPLNARVISVEDATCSDRTDGKAILEVSGGIPPYTSNIGIWDNNRLTISGLTGGSHTVEISDSGNTPSVVQQISIKQPEPLVSTVIWEKENECYGDSNGGADIFISGGTPPYTYSEGYWTGSVLAFHMYSAGTYYITIDDANGCGPIIQEVVLTQPEPLVTELVYTKDASCNGGNDGEAAFFITGGTLSYTVPGFEQDGLYIINELRADYYVLEAGDGWGCPFLLEFEINQPDAISNLEPVTVDASAEGLRDGQVSITLSGGTPPYFANGEQFSGNTWTRNNLAPGMYSTTFTDSKNCFPFEVAFEIGFSSTKDISVEASQSSGNPLSRHHSAGIRGIYPNPASTEATIELLVSEDIEGSIDLYSLSGHKIAALYQGMLQGGDVQKKTFSISTIPPGIYLFRITTRANIYNQKVIISR
jgi:hypothetical protein